MIFNLSKVFVALAAFTAVSASAILEKRQANAVTCDYVLKPDTAVTPTDAEFNFTIGRSLSIDAGGSVFNFGSTFTANLDSTFSVENKISADGKTAAETAAIITGWVGETKTGLSANWLVESVTCV
ncbi:hypothetical protein GALMADRAFT_1346340 [Galerina marginata CBS 339.88]|uniref:Reelin domain-containing protein n=1 Tax=Galerina marginata (strain CBS 339.88) TaxID=685588 RepID=A0A067SL76_GALM3|nr:hypothetical protein GALMADRAFT_1346340 [Galerina marginata CBS 339.88]